MLKKWILLFSVILVAGLTLPVGATQYNPPWAHNYGFYFPADPANGTPAVDSRPYATNASNYQSIIGYDAYDLPNSSAYVGYTNIKDDAVFFIITHGTDWGVWNDRGGGVQFYNGSKSVIVAEYRGYTPTDDHYFLSSMSTELEDLLLVVWASCYTARTSPRFGNLVDITHQKGADNVIGFSDSVYWTHLMYWSDRFWYRCLYGQAGSPQTIRNAANGARMDTILTIGGFGGIDTMFGRYRYPYVYLDPARYGAV